MKNYIGQTLGLSLLTLLFIGALNFVPKGLSVGDFQLRTMDIFADIRAQPATVVQDTVSAYVPDTLALVTPDTSKRDSSRTDSLVIREPLPPIDSMFFGSRIEDYTRDQKGLSHFFAAVDSIKTNQRTVRVAFFGDSFIEGDILIGDLRDTLQTLWGGAGVGFVPITSEVARFKRTLVHSFENWNTFSIVKKTPVYPPYGINGFVYQPRADATMHYEGATYFHHTKSWSRLRLFYSASQANSFLWQRKGEPYETGRLEGQAGRINVWQWGTNQQETNAVTFRFPQPAGLLLYGASLENGPGIYIDNFSVRGNTGGPLKLIQTDVMRQFDQFQRYDLIVIQVGLNAVTNSLNNINWYRAELDRTFAHLEASFPGKPILVISVGDRAGKTEDGGLATMRSVPYIVAMQRDLARKHGLMFYDLFRGMGGPGTMITMANHKPMLANKDYTHLTHDGGRVVGYMFARLFAEEQAKYESKKSVHLSN